MDNTGDIIVVGLLALLLFILVVAFWMYRRRQRSLKQVIEPLKSAADVSIVDEAPSPSASMQDLRISATSAERTVTLHNGSDNPLTATQQIGGTTTAGTDTLAPAISGLSIPGFLEIKKTDYKVIKLLYKGKKGSIYLGNGLRPRLNRFGDNIIIKILNSESMSDRDLDEFNQEVAIMAFFDKNPRFVKILGFSYEPAAIIMKSYELGSLEHWIFSSNTTKTKRQIMKFAIELAHALNDMHRVGFVHGDVKPGNILIEATSEKELSLVLSDFAMVQVVDNTVMLVKEFRVAVSHGLSMAFAAPEYINRVRVGDKLMDVNVQEARAADVYSYAIVLYELVTRCYTWAA